LGVPLDMIGQDGLVAAVEQSADAIVVTDVRGVIQYVNPAFTRMTGYTSEEVLGKNPSILKSGLEATALYEELWSRVHAGRVWNGQITNRRKDGTFYTEAMRISPVLNSQGQIVNYIAIKHDVTAQRASEDAQRFLAAIVESSEDAIIGTRLDGTILSWNRSAEALFGYSSQEIAGKHMEILAPPENRGELLAMIADVLDGRICEPWETVRQTRVGRLFHVLERHSPIRNPAGEVTGLAVVLRDIGRRLKIERKVREGAERFREVFDQSPFAIAISGADGRFMQVNGALSKMLGYSERELLATGWADLTHPDDLAPSRDIIRQFNLDPDQTLTLEKRYLHRNGTTVWTHMRVSRIHDSAGNRSCHMAHMEDITEKRRADQALRETQQRFHIMADGCPSPMWVTNAVGGVEFINRAYREFCGTTYEKVEGNQWQLLVHPDDQESFAGAFAKAVLQHTVFCAETRIRGANGDWRWVASNAEPRFSSDGEYLGHVGLSTDVTERRQAEQTVRDAQEFAQATIDALSSHICVLDETGKIISVNRAWKEFALANDRAESGTKRHYPPASGCFGDDVNYLDVCDRVAGPEKQEATEFAAGIRTVLNCEEESYSTEYSCHSPTEQRWFMSRVTRFSSDRVRRVVVEHINITERKQAEETVRLAKLAAEAETRRLEFQHSLIQTIQEGSLDGILVVNHEEVIVSHNRRLLDVWQIPMHAIQEGLTDQAHGVELGLVLQLALERVKHPDNFLKRVRDLYDDPEAIDNSEIELNDGRVLERYSAGLRSNSGQYLGRVWFFRDITTRKLADQALQCSEEKFLQLTDNIREAFWMMDASGDEFLYVSPAYAQIWGQTCESLYENPLQWGDSIHLDDREQAREGFEKYLGGDCGAREYRITTPDGLVKWIRDRAFPVRDQAGAIIRLAGIAEDITESKKAADRLKESAERLALATRAASVGIWDCDLVLNRTVWDDQMYRLYGVAKNQTSNVDEAWLAALHPEDAPRCLEEILMARRGEKDFNTEFRVIWPDESIHTIRALALVQRDASGKPRQMIGTNWDITDQKEAADKLLQSNRHLEKTTIRANELATKADAANRAKSEFLANMSHEIRTPMNGIIGMTELLLETNLTAEQRQFAEIQRGSGEALLKLLNDILDISKIEAGRVEMEKLDFDLIAFLTDTMAPLKLRANDKGLKLLWAADSDVPRLVRGDPGRLRQILANLTGNATKFTSAGEVRIGVSMLNETRDQVLLRFSVKDTGIGIPNDKLGILFNKFSQVDASTTRKFGGTGLGLAISKQLAELMGGEVGITSQEGAGSEFWFTVRLGLQDEHAVTGTSVPLHGTSDSSKTAHSSKAAQVRNPPLEQSLAPSNLATLRILLAEDNLVNQKVAVGILRNLGFDADVVDNGEQAVNAVASGQYDLVLMDVQMPIMDGFEATHQIRLLEGAMPARSIPTVAMTAHALKGDRERCIEAGMNDHLAKPVSRKALDDVLRRWMPVEVNPQSAGKNSAGFSHHRLPLPKVFDRAGLLDRLMNDLSLAQLVTETFLEDIPHQIRALHLCVEASDTLGAGRLAHLLRGAAGNVGGESLSTIAFEMEEAANAGNLSALSAKIDELDLCFEQLRQAMTASA